MTNPDEPGCDLDLDVLSPHFHTAEAAVEYLERLRWANGRVCPHCGVLDGPEREHYRIKTESTKRKLWKCYSCRKQFTVTVGTIFEDSHVPLHKWLLAFYLLCSSKKGMSALQLQRMLKRQLQDRVVHVPSHPMGDGEPAFTEKLSGVVEADETYVGGKARNRHKRYDGVKKTGRGTDKAPVMLVVQRGGHARSRHIANVSGDEVKGFIRLHVDRRRA